MRVTWLLKPIEEVIGRRCYNQGLEKYMNYLVCSFGGDGNLCLCHSVDVAEEYQELDIRSRSRAVEVFCAASDVVRPRG